MLVGKEMLEERYGKKNMPKSWYVNCYGFAFGLNGWYEPVNEQTLEEMLYPLKPEERKSFDEIEEVLVKSITQEMGCDPISKSVVENIDFNPEKETIIAFRVYRCYPFFDFHFLRTDNNGDWEGKMGHSSYIEHHNFECVFDEKTWGRYDGNIYFFMIKK